MSVSTFFTKLSFHLGSSRPMQPCYITFLFSLGLHFIFLFTIRRFTTFEYNSFGDCFFYIHRLIF